MPADRLFVVLRHPLASAIMGPQADLGTGVPLLGGEAMPAESLFFVLFHLCTFHTAVQKSFTKKVAAMPIRLNATTSPAQTHMKPFRSLFTRDLLVIENGTGNFSK